MDGARAWYWVDTLLEHERQRQHAGPRESIRHQHERSGILDGLATDGLGLELLDRYVERRVIKDRDALYDARALGGHVARAVHLRAIAGEIEARVVTQANQSLNRSIKGIDSERVVLIERGVYEFEYQELEMWLRVDGSDRVIEIDRSIVIRIAAVTHTHHANHQTTPTTKPTTHRYIRQSLGIDLYLWRGDIHHTR